MAQLLKTLWLTVPLFLVACGDKDASPEGSDSGGSSVGEEGGDDGPGDTGEVPRDADGDGYLAIEDGGDDCDDDDPAVNPGASEVCDEVDNDCDGTVDQGAADAATWYADLDGDGHGDPDNSAASCAQPEGFLADVEVPDCDDTDADVNPGADDADCDGVDDNCDGAVDEGSERVPTDHLSLLAAVDVLADGSEICVEPGTYVEQLDLSGRSLRLVGQQGPSATVWDVGSSAPLLTVGGGSGSDETGEVSVSGFTVSGADVSAEGTQVRGVFAHVDGGALTLSDIHVAAMAGAVSGGGSLEGVLVYGIDSHVILEDIAVDEVGITLGGGGSGEDTVTGGLVRTLRGELEIDGLDVSGLSITTDGTGSECLVYGAALATDDDGSLNSEVAELVGTEVHLTDLVLRDTTLSLDCQGEARAGSLLYLADAGGEVQGVTVTGTAVTLASADSAWGRPLIYAWRLRDGMAWSELSLSNNSQDVTAARCSTGGLLDVDGAHVSHLSGTANATADHCESGDAWSGTLVSVTSGALAHLDLRGNQRASLGRASDLVVVYAEGGDSTLRHFVVAGNQTEAAEVSGGALQLGAELGSLTVHNGDIVGNRFTGPPAYGGLGLVWGGGDETGDLVALTNLQGVDNTHDDDEPLPAVSTWWDETFQLTHSNLFGNTSDETSWGDATGTDGNISADPLYTDVSATDPTTWDLRLQSGSPAIDAGEPSLTDDDGSTSDMGAYGGPGGSGW